MMTGERDRLVGLIYDGVMDDEAWSLALAQVRRLVGAIGVGLGMQHMRTHAFRSLGAVGISADLNPTYQRLAADNRIWREIARRNKPLTDQMVMSKAALVRTELYADWFRPQGFHSVMAFPTLFKNDASVTLAALRGRALGNFEPADLVRLGLFAEHFGRAIAIRLDREQTATDLAAARRTLDAFEDAILIVDRACRILHANAAARTMLDAGRTIRLCKGRLEVQNPEADQWLMRTAAQARGGELRLVGPAAKVIHIHPSLDGLGANGAGCMMVRIVDPNREGEPLTPTRLRDRLGLTPRQSEVVAALAAGATEAEAAHNLKVGEPTLHTHVRRVYDRLDLRSRAQLMGLLARHGFHIVRK